MIEFPRSDRFGNVTSIDGRPLLRATGPSPFFRSRKPLDIFVIDPVLGILGAVENIAAGVRGLVHGKEVTVADRNPLKFPDRPRSRSIARYRAAAAFVGILYIAANLSSYNTGREIDEPTASAVSTSAQKKQNLPNTPIYEVEEQPRSIPPDLYANERFIEWYRRTGVSVRYDITEAEVVIKPGVSERVVPDLSDDNNRAGITSKELTVFGSVFTVMHSGKEEKWVRFVKPDGTMVFTREESPGGERLARITLVRK